MFSPVIRLPYPITTKCHVPGGHMITEQATEQDMRKSLSKGNKPSRSYEIRAESINGRVAKLKERLFSAVAGWWLRHQPAAGEPPVAIGALRVTTVYWPDERTDETLFMPASVDAGGDTWISAATDDVRDLQEAR